MIGTIIAIISGLLVLTYLSHYRFLGGAVIPYWLCIFCLYEQTIGRIFWKRCKFCNTKKKNTHWFHINMSPQHLSGYVCDDCKPKQKEFLSNNAEHILAFSMDGIIVLKTSVGTKEALAEK